MSSINPVNTCILVSTLTGVLPSVLAQGFLMCHLKPWFIYLVWKKVDQKSFHSSSWLWNSFVFIFRMKTTTVEIHPRRETFRSRSSGWRIFSRTFCSSGSTTSPSCSGRQRVVAPAGGWTLFLFISYFPLVHLIYLYKGQSRLWTFLEGGFLSC